ncbi:MAG: UPF0716 protein FxsA [Pirellulaceae bacterium]|jgi:UPF0716 protein FxsA
MLTILLLLFIIVPIVELSLLVRLAHLITWPWTISIVIITGIVGSMLARQQGWSAWRRLQEELGDGKVPVALVDTIMIFVAGAFLITPGILTDIFGLTLLIPFCRGVYRALLVRYFKGRLQLQSFASVQYEAGVRPETYDGDPDVLDSYVVDDESEPSKDTRRDGPDLIE